MNKLNEIRVVYGKKRKIAEICNCSEQSVRFALRGSVEEVTDLIKKIRKEAIKLGGVEIKTGRRL